MGEIEEQKQAASQSEPEELPSFELPQKEKWSLTPISKNVQDVSKVSIMQSILSKKIGKTAPLQICKEVEEALGGKCTGFKTGPKFDKKLEHVAWRYSCGNSSGFYVWIQAAKMIDFKKSELNKSSDGIEQASNFEIVESNCSQTEQTKFLHVTKAFAC